MSGNEKSDRFKSVSKTIMTDSKLKPETNYKEESHIPHVKKVTYTNATY